MREMSRVDEGQQEWTALERDSCIRIWRKRCTWSIQIAATCIAAALDSADGIGS